MPNNQQDRNQSSQSNQAGRTNPSQPAQGQANQPKGNVPPSSKQRGGMQDDPNISQDPRSEEDRPRANKK